MRERGRTMLENVNLTAKGDEVMKMENKSLCVKLGVLQQKMKEAGIPNVVVFEGWGTSGKGSLIGKLILNMDPRNFNVYVTAKSTSEDLRRPYLYQFWNNIPGKGQMTIFDKSWYHEYKKKNTESINVFERQLVDNGYLVIKMFLHITEEEQENRIHKLLQDKATSWRVSKRDLKENRKYNKTLEKYNDMLEATNTEIAPWTVILGMDKTLALNCILKNMITSIEARLQDESVKTGVLPQDMKFELVDMPKLSEVNLDFSVTEEVYREKIDELQKKLRELSYKLYKANIPLILGYEGWDAAGKGGNIKRVAGGLDPRDYDVTPIAAPDYIEKNRHYLWRFWKNIPKSGHVQIFDRTWYGRVMVERIEGFCSKEDYMRAYNEINEFEKELTDWGAIVIKFWLQIDQDEQLARFNERQNTPEKRYKITDEDWRNREKWDSYEVAVDDMLKYTSTPNAQWHIIESNNKYFARLKTLEIIISEIEKRLKKTS